VILCAAGLRATLAPPKAVAPSSAGAPATDFAAGSVAVRFSRAYLTFDAARPRLREAALAPFVGSAALDAGAGFAPPDNGSQRVVWAEVVQVQRPLFGGAIYTVAVQLDRRIDPVYLSVPVTRLKNGAVALNGYPSFVGPPLTAPPPPEELSGESVSDPEVERLVERSLTNYLAGDAEDFSADLAQAAAITLPPNELRLVGLQELTWVSKPGSGAVLATVTAADPAGGRYTLRYEVGIRPVEGGDPQIAPGWRVTYVQTLSEES